MNQTHELVAFATCADKEARSDLALSFIRGEDDYTSNFTGALRRIINSNSRTGLSANSFVLPHKIERSIGCDAVILIQSSSEFKIAVFEAKLPRLSKPNAWDYTQKKTGDSHFGDQLKRQAKIAGNVAVFEMFYCEAPFKRQVKEMHDELSSCVWHSDALAHDKTRAGPTWTFAHLRALLGRSSLQIGDVLNVIV